MKLKKEERKNKEKENSKTNMKNVNSTKISKDCGLKRKTSAISMFFWNVTFPRRKLTTNLGVHRFQRKSGIPVGLVNNTHSSAN